MRHTFKLTNYTVLPGTRGISVENITFIHDEFKQYGSAVINIPEDITILSVSVYNILQLLYMTYEMHYKALKKTRKKYEIEQTISKVRIAINGICFSAGG